MLGFLKVFGICNDNRKIKLFKYVIGCVSMFNNIVLFYLCGIFFLDIDECGSVLFLVCESLKICINIWGGFECVCDGVWYGDECLYSKLKLWNKLICWVNYFFIFYSVIDYFG